MLKTGKFNVEHSVGDTGKIVVKFFSAEGGGMISSYYADTILNIPRGQGLCLDAGIEGAEITDKQVAIVKRWLLGFKFLRNGHLSATTMRDYDDRKKASSKYPAERDVLQRFLVEQQMGPLNTNDDGDISHREVTQWYVREYCRLNCLRATS